MYCRELQAPSNLVIYKIYKGSGEPLPNPVRTHTYEYTGMQIPRSFRHLIAAPAASVA